MRITEQHRQFPATGKYSRKMIRACVRDLLSKKNPERKHEPSCGCPLRGAGPPYRRSLNGSPWIGGKGLGRTTAPPFSYDSITAKMYSIVARASRPDARTFS